MKAGFLWYDRPIVVVLWLYKLFLNLIGFIFSNKLSYDKQYYVAYNGEIRQQCSSVVE